MPVARASFDAFTAVADPTRRAMLERLLPCGAERTAGELGADFGLSQPTVSQHLKVLREAGLVSFRDEGRCRIYQLRPGPLDAVHRWINKVVEVTDPAGHVWRIRSEDEED
jgi:DNA-binding transcriptional ArsR family regulator